jgi:hypothetical protein
MDCGGDDGSLRILGELIARDMFVRMPSVAPLNAASG